jgi:hypothetical protein
MYYRSDWPEIGLSAATSEGMPTESPAQTDKAGELVELLPAEGLELRWIAVNNGFESGLYGYPIWELRVEARDIESSLLQTGPGSRLETAIKSGLRRLIASPPWGTGYLFSRVLKTEPLYAEAMAAGFCEVEQRRLYKTHIQNILPGIQSHRDDNIRFLSLDEMDPERHELLRAQILEICHDVFGERGYSRHFTDAFLWEKLPGSSYIAAAMKLNFSRLGPDSFLLALDDTEGCVCGFSVVGEKPGLIPGLYTQLLSAVRREYQGREIYSGFTRLLTRKLPPEATLLNVTHAANHAIQAAYQRSGRILLAETVIVRRIFQGGTDVL